MVSYGAYLLRLPHIMDGSGRDGADVKMAGAPGAMPPGAIVRSLLEPPKVNLWPCKFPCYVAS